MSSLHDLIDVKAEKWEHEPDDKLVGEILARSSYVGDKGYEPCQLLTILVDEPGSTEAGGQPIPIGAERLFYASRTVPRSAVEEQDPRGGDRIGIKYFGEVRDKGYFDYKIRVLRAAGRPETTVEPSSTNLREGEPDEEEDLDDDGIPF